MRGFTAFAGDRPLFFFVHCSKTATAGRAFLLGLFMRGCITIGQARFTAVTAVVRIKFVFVITLQPLIVVVVKFIIFTTRTFMPRKLVILIRTMMPGCFLSSGSFCLCDHKLRI